MIIYYTDRFPGGSDESRRLLEKALSVHTGNREQAKILIRALKKGEHGKPYIEGFSCFSISHTGNIWAVLVAECECGLDIQLYKKCDIRAISERWFAPEDAALMAAAPDEDNDEMFFRIWTRREALVKTLGGTVYDPCLPAVSSGDLSANGSNYTIRDISFPEMPDLYAAVCFYNTGSPSELNFIHL